MHPVAHHAATIRMARRRGAARPVISERRVARIGAVDTAAFGRNLMLGAVLQTVIGIALVAALNSDNADTEDAIGAAVLIGVGLPMVVVLSLAMFITGAAMWQASRWRPR